MKYLVVLLLLLSSCAPIDSDYQQSLSFIIRNQHIESTFTLTYEVDGSSGIIFDNVRIGIYGNEIADNVITIPRGTRIHPTLIVAEEDDESLFRNFQDPSDSLQGILVNNPKRPVLHLIYTGSTVRYGWGLP
jgi:hypothetical protein